VSTVHRGPGQYSVEFDKTGVTQTYAQIEKTVDALDGTHWAVESYVNYFVYIAAGDIANITSVYFAIGTDNGNYWFWRTPVAELSAGWNYVSHSLAEIDGEVGTGAQMNNITWAALRVIVSVIGDTLTNTRLDDIRLERADSVAVMANDGVDIGDVDVTSLPGTTEADIGDILTAAQLIDNFISVNRGLVTEDNSADIKTSTDGLAQATPTAYNISVDVGSTEYSQALPANTRAIEFRSRLEVDVIYSFEAGKVAGPTANYLTLDGGLQYYKEGLNLTGKTLYVAGTAGDVVELLAWS